MLHSGLKTALVFSLLSLTACAQKPQLKQVQQEIRTLNNNISTLSQQAVLLARQNALNSNSQRGAYLLPDADGEARLYSQSGLLAFSLPEVKADGNATQITLIVKPIQPSRHVDFSAAIAWGEKADQPENERGQMAFSVAQSAMEQGAVTLHLRLADITPAQLGFIRIHDIQPLEPSPSQPATPP